MDGHSFRESKMRASFFTDKCQLDESSQTIMIMGEECDHLVVTRVKIGEDLLVLNGKGLKFETEVIDIQKRKFVQVKIKRKIQEEKNHHLTLGLGLPKKEALERSMQIAQEFNLSCVQLIDCEFTQFKSFKQDRFEKIMIGAMKQSNSSYLTSLEAAQKLKEINWERYDKVLYLDPYACLADKGQSINLRKERIMLLVGPEGGFSEAELEIIKSIKNLSRLKICDSILRVETCVAGALAYILKSNEAILS